MYFYLTIIISGFVFCGPVLQRNDRYRKQLNARYEIHVLIYLFILFLPSDLLEQPAKQLFLQQNIVHCYGIDFAVGLVFFSSFFFFPSNNFETLSHRLF